jgi:hypothetical protein
VFVLKFGSFWWSNSFRSYWPYLILHRTIGFLKLKFEIKLNMKATFVIPHIDDNLDGWGPQNIPEQFKDVPYYTPYNKGDKLGKAADWQQVSQSKGIFSYDYNPLILFKGRPTGQKDGVNTIFNYYYQDEDSSFILVDNAPKQGRRQLGFRRFQNRNWQQMR